MICGYEAKEGDIMYRYVRHRARKVNGKSYKVIYRCPKHYKNMFVKV